MSSEAGSQEEFEGRLNEGDHDLVLSDFNILGYEGLQVIDAVRARNAAVPVVIVTGTGSEEIAVEAMKRGAASDDLPATFGRDPAAPETAPDAPAVRAAA